MTGKICQARVFSSCFVHHKLEESKVIYGGTINCVFVPLCVYVCARERALGNKIFFLCCMCVSVRVRERKHQRSGLGSCGEANFWHRLWCLWVGMHVVAEERERGRGKK
jgi:hypothetical protein